MSLLRRRMMMQAAASDPIPRERIVFSHAGDEIVKDGLKRYDGDAICGIVILHQTYYLNIFDTVIYNIIRSFRRKRKRWFYG